MTIELKIGDPYKEKGVYQPPTKPNPERIDISCPQCGTPTETDHEISEDGTVTPSLLCDCGWHEFAKLAGWKWGKIPLPGGWV